MKLSVGGEIFGTLKTKRRSNPAHAPLHCVMMNPRLYIAEDLLLYFFTAFPFKKKFPGSQAGQAMSKYDGWHCVKHLWSRTHRCFTTPFRAISGTVSPYDTGGGTKKRGDREKGEGDKGEGEGERRR